MCAAAQVSEQRFGASAIVASAVSAQFRKYGDVGPKRVRVEAQMPSVLSTSAPNGNRDSPPSSDCLVTSMTYARMIVTHSNRVGGVNSALQPGAEVVSKTVI